MTGASERLSTDALSADEISDAVWLAARIAAAEQTRRPTEPALPPPPPAPPPSASVPIPRKTSDGPPPLPARELARLALTGSESPAHRAPQRQTSAAPVTRERPASPALPRGLAKSLLPLKRLVPSKLRRELDEEETAVTAAESGLWLPVHRPSHGHPFEVVLVVDSGSSMRIWAQTTDAFRVLLERQGAFSDVKTVWVNTDEKTVHSVETAPGTACPPAQLADPTGRRIILALTDGVGPAWRSGSMFALMSMWARTCRVALVHLLPVERWSWTGLHVEPRSIRDIPPGTASPIPVLALERRYLRRWAELVSGAARIRLPVLMPSDGDTEEWEPEDVSSADERLRRFRATATPHAVRLAALLAAAPLTLRVIQAVHGTFMPESQPWHLAEVLLGRLLYRVPRSPRGDQPSVEPVEYEFLTPGLRRGLLSKLDRDETARVQRVVEDVLGAEEPAVANLRGVLTAPDNATLPVVTARTAPLLAVQREVLAALSGPYTRRANRLGDALDAYSRSQQSSVPSSQTRNEPPPAATNNEMEIGFGPSEVSSGPIQVSRGMSVTTTSSEPGTEVHRSVRQPAVWGGVPLRNVNFIGRKELLAAVHTELGKSTATAVLPGALHGMGGIGKSQIAVEYVYRHAVEYDLIWWIPSENLSEMGAALLR